MSSIQNIMISNPVHCSPGDTVEKACQDMTKHNLGAILLEENGKLVGIFSERDLVNRVVSEGMDPKTTLVGDVSTKSPVTVTKDTKIKECAKIIKDGKFRHLPVVDASSKPIGIISSRDFFTYVSGGLEEYIDQVLYEREIEEGVDPYDHLGGGYED